MSSAETQYRRDGIFPIGRAQSRVQPSFNSGQKAEILNTISKLKPRETKQSQGDVGVAGHELNHIFASLGNFVFATCRPGDGYRGMMVHDITLTPSNLREVQIVASAGMVDTPEGPAQGYGSDWYKAKMLEMYGVGSATTAQAEASARIRSVPHAVRARMAVLFAERGNITQSDLYEIERQARFDVFERPKLLADNLAELLRLEDEERKHQMLARQQQSLDPRTLFQPGRTYQIDVVGKDGRMVVFIVKDNKAFPKCMACGGEMYHSSSCSQGYGGKIQTGMVPIDELIGSGSTLNPKGSDRFDLKAPRTTIYSRV
ncbi:MAG: hypothetical protein WCO06_02090 [Candidatus Roizmanbacteria bacterium]